MLWNSESFGSAVRLPPRVVVVVMGFGSDLEGGGGAWHGTGKHASPHT